MKTDNEAHTAGFVTPYAMSEPVEDYAEMMSVYVTSTPQEWNAIIADAGVEGARLINNKLEMVRSYMNEQWNLDMDDLRDAVIRRAGELDKLDLETLN
jgi:substrate import-associated zinc metallohydrolase lipoprotein